MPELPEVETIRSDLEQTILKKKIVNIKVLKKRMIKGNHKTLINKTIQSIQRRGKLLILKIKDNYLLLHLGMTGQIIYNPKSKKYPNKHTYALITLNNKTNIYCQDIRMFGYMSIIDQTKLNQILSNNYGIEPLTHNFTLANLKQTLTNRKAPIKTILLNQKLVAGLGNIYVDEICFASGIKPSRKTNNLTPDEIKKIFLNSNKIIKKSILSRGTSFSDYKDTKGEKGNYLTHLKVYGRYHQPCVKCKTSISRIKIAGRSTHYCPRCQK